MGLFSKKKKTPIIEEQVIADKVEFCQIADDDNLALDLVKKLTNGAPLVINFEKLDLTTANKYLAFFTGALAALGDEPKRITDTMYLFATKAMYEDGTLAELLSQIE